MSSLWFRPQASANEKLYTILTIALVGLMLFGMFYDVHVNFGAEPGIPLLLVAVSLPFAFIHWLPAYRDRHPLNRVRSLPFIKRVSFYAGYFLFSLSLIWFALMFLLAPYITSSFGTSGSADYIVTEKSSGRYERRSCTYYVRLQDRSSEWKSKICIGEQFWSTARVGDVLIGSGNQTVFGRTIEDLSQRGG